MDLCNKAGTTPLVTNSTEQCKEPLLFSILFQLKKYIDCNSLNEASEFNLNAKNTKKDTAAYILFIVEAYIEEKYTDCNLWSSFKDDFYR